MAIKEISVTLINKQRRVDCFNAVDPPFFLPHSTPHTKTVSTARLLDSEYSRIKAAEHR